MGFNRVDVEETTEQLETIAKIVTRYGRELEKDDVRKLDTAAGKVTRAIAYEAIRLGLEGWKVVRTDEVKDSNPGSEDA